MEKEKIKIKLTFEIKQESFDLLKKISEAGYAEYRDAEWPSLKKFESSLVFLEGKRTREWYLERNFGGTYELLEELIHFNLVEFEEDAWNITYKLSEFGKQVLEKKYEEVQ